MSKIDFLKKIYLKSKNQNKIKQVICRVIDKIFFLENFYTFQLAYYLLVDIKLWKYYKIL